MGRVWGMKWGGYAWKVGVACLGFLNGALWAALEPIKVSDDGKHFIRATSHEMFRVWGVNYDHDTVGKGRLIEDYWMDEWETVVEDFREIKALGGNVVRVHLQLGKFMLDVDTANAESLAQLKKLLSMAEETEIYLNLTGLGCYHQADVPAWYDALSERERWQVQANFWKSVSRVCRDSPAVFCYDLMNEPVIGGKKEEGWVGGEISGKHFVQRLTLDAGGRTSLEIAQAWVRMMTEAIRAEDPHHLVTVGVIPWAHVWPNAKPLFYSPEVGSMLDFVSIHLYPKSGEVDQAVTALKVYDIGKPLLIEETFPLACSLEEMDEFLMRTREIAEGYMSFYWGKTVEEYHAEKEEVLLAALMSKWLQYFQKMAPIMKENQS